MKTYINHPRGFALTLLMALVVPSISLAQEKADLLIVCVGVSKYLDKRFEGGVVYSAKDAQNVADTFLGQKGKRFNRVEAKVLLDEKATGENIQSAIDWLQKSATPQSHVIVYLSGHGGPNGVGAYEYVVHDTHPLVSSTRLQGKWLSERMQKIAGTRFLLLDTCHAGGFGFKGTDFTALASCGAKQFSGEQAALQNGFFTRCLLEGFSGKADTNFDGVVSIAEIEAYVSKHLPTMTQGKQEVTAHRPASVANDLPMIRLATPVTFAKTGPRVNAAK
jgi:uncharacterized caspase-like protein